MSYTRPPGFTLFEVLIVLVLVSMLLCFATPSIHQMLVRGRLSQHANQLIAALHFARSEAIKTGQIVIFCKSADHKTCGGQWRDGQIVLLGDKVLRVYAGLTAGDELQWQSSLGKNDSLRWAPTGFTMGQKGSFNYCSADKQASVRIVVEYTGRVRVEKGGGC